MWGANIKTVDIKRLLKYLALGGCGATSDTLLFYLLNKEGMTPILSNSLSISVGIAISYSLNSRYTFNQEKISRITATKFLFVGILGLAVSNLLLWLLIEQASTPTIVGKLLTLPLVAIIQFIINQSWTFKSD